MITTIVSGGQTGVDRAALDWALSRGLAIAGWCPSGRKAEDGRLDPQYSLKETPSSGYTQRTRWNVRDSDGTLILVRGELQGGSALTARVAEKLGRPLLVLDLDAPSDENIIRLNDWLAGRDVRILNIAGPRESGRPGIYRDVQRFLTQFAAGEMTET